MKSTKETIKEKAIDLFNKKGFKNITLREVAKEMNKSYGNITYHYKTKEQLVNEILEDFNYALNKLEIYIYTNNFKNLLNLSKLNYKLIKKYLFVLLDNLEIRRSYPKTSKKIDYNLLFLKEKRIVLFLENQENGNIKKNYKGNVFNFLNELIIGKSILFFQSNILEKMNSKEYIKEMNRIIFPYLTDKGKLVYIKN